MACYSVFTKILGEINALKLAEAIERMSAKPFGVGVFRIEDNLDTWEVGIYFLEEPNELQIKILEVAFSVKFTVSKVEDRDWVSQVNRELTMVEAGRFIIYGSHDRNIVPVNKNRICIDAAMAFGTGHHSSTVGCLLALDYLAQKKYWFLNIADIGCGTGILAMAAAKVYNGSITAVDINDIAFQTARANIFRNGYRSRICLFKSKGFKNSEFLRRAPFDLIFANILAKPLCELSMEMFKYCSNKGVLVLSGILNRQARKVENYYLSCGFSRLDVRRVSEWTTLLMIKKS